MNGVRYDIDCGSGKPSAVSAMQQFSTGATRSTEGDKLDPEGFLSPAVIRRYSEYLHKHRVQADGQKRDSDNWTRGIPRRAYMKSMWRHFLAVWSIHRGLKIEEDQEEALCAVIFNAMGYLHEVLLGRDTSK